MVVMKVPAGDFLVFVLSSDIGMQGGSECAVAIDHIQLVMTGVHSIYHTDTF